MKTTRHPRSITDPIPMCSEAPLLKRMIPSNDEVLAFSFSQKIRGDSLRNSGIDRLADTWSGNRFLISVSPSMFVVVIKQGSELLQVFVDRITRSQGTSSFLNTLMMSPAYITECELSYKHIFPLSFFPFAILSAPHHHWATVTLPVTFSALCLHNPHVDGLCADNC